MERSKSLPGHYSSLYGDGRFGFEDRSKSYSFNGPSSQAADDEFASSGNPEMKRRKRVAAYNMYAMEGKLKSSLRNSFKWIKSKFVDTYYDD
ncbi:hypothetical protein TorRG33x02_308860 [Trema orientale]|uniref:Uncharacterized protein n=1 Tax=Trema orientale TaxID=63057 RepID=A0A2P5BU01_TREOI|nr:hypothetical protein TorRG33x02_308860 [Trema orientale]